ncbi:hypothetical protein ACFV3E_43050 [Streptomyces sp. NPDC059718]
MSQGVDVVWDDTVLGAAGRGNLLGACLIRRAPAEAGRHLYVPTCALVAASRGGPGRCPT